MRFAARAPSSASMPRPRRGQQQRHHLARRRRVRVDPVDGAEARVRDVVVDVDDGHAREQLGVVGQDRPDALEVAAVADDDEVGVEVRFGSRAEALDVGHEVVHRGHRVRADDVDACAARLQRQADRERGPERVGLGVAMADGHHPPRPRAVAPGPRRAPLRGPPGVSAASDSAAMLAFPSR